MSLPSWLKPFEDLADDDVGVRPLAIDGDDGGDGTWFGGGHDAAGARGWAGPLIP